MEPMPRSIPWTSITLAEAWDLRRLWDESSDARMEWLAAQSGLALIDDRDAVMRVWMWLLSWADDPTGLDQAPQPVWWAPPTDGSLAYRRQIGLESFCTYLERLVWTRYPDLVPAVAVEGHRDWSMPHYVGLSFDPESPYGCPWPTANMVRTGMVNILPMDSADRRRANWGPSEYDYIPVWVENRRRAKTEMASASIFMVERIPADEAEEIGGYLWEISVDPTFAEEHEDLLDAYVHDLAQLSDVDDVEHYDRDAIRVSGPIRIRKLRSWSTKWAIGHETT